MRYKIGIVSKNFWSSTYDSRTAVLQGTAGDLVPKRPGPPPSKRTQEVAALIIRTRCETAGHMYEIAATLTPRGGPGRARLVGQVLTAYGLAQKNG